MVDDELNDFRRRVRHFFDHQVPVVMGGIEGQVARGRAWRTALTKAGLTGLDYPIELGGQGLGPRHVETWEQQSAGRVPSEDSIFRIGVSMALPVIRDHGSQELQRRFIPPALRGEEIWCQLYSEPEAGSDLAALTTRAVADGDEWVVTGQKVWTSGAQHSQLAILLARTDFDVPKHRGITMFVLPMEQPGVTVRPLRQMTGNAEFNEVFLDEARLPGSWVVGQVNDGWRVAVALLAYERVHTGVSSMSNAGNERLWARVPIPFAQLQELARVKDRLHDPLIRQDLARLYINEQIVGYLRQRGNTHPSIGKLWRTRHGRDAAQLAARLSFPASPAWPEGDDDAFFFSYQILNCRGMSLGGGTDEIQRNTVGERVLGLPREPSVDRDLPFRELTRSTARTGGSG